MPRAEDNEEHVSSEGWAQGYGFFEDGQRHGLYDDERRISGCKRICYCYGRIQGYCQKYIIFILMISYMIVYIIGYYSGVITNCLYEGSDLI